MTCYIFGAAPFAAIAPHMDDGDLVIAADGGLYHTDAQGIHPHVVIGDFDSLGHVPTGAEVIKLPVEKDVTDMAAAIHIGRARGYRRFVLLGATGARPDHTMANYQLLSDLALHGEEGYLVGENFSVTAISDGSSLIFDHDLQGTFSVFSVSGDAHGVNICGGYYSLADGMLAATTPMGVSNSFTGEEVTVSVAKGTLLVMWEGQRLPRKKVP